jgi:hypothetical protein
VFERFANTDTVGHLRIGRIAQDPILAADHDRRFIRSNLEVRKQRIHPRVVFEIDPGKRNLVLCKELADPMRVARISRAHHPGTREAGFFEQLPAHEKGPEQDIAQLRISFRIRRRSSAEIS